MKPKKKSVALAAAMTMGLAFAACGGGSDEAKDIAPTGPAVTSAEPTSPSITASSTVGPTSTSATGSTVVSADSAPFPVAVFAGLPDEPVSDALAAELQAVLDATADGDGVTATLITPKGTWSGATGFAAGDRAMTPDDQMPIGSITKSVVATQVMQLVEDGALALDDRVADRLPPDVLFDTNGSTIVDLLSMRSGYPDPPSDSAAWATLWSDPLRVWTPQELLDAVPDERGPVGQTFEYRGTPYVLLGLIIEHVTGRPLADVLRSGVLDGAGYERLIYQPDERPTEPIAMPDAAAADTLDDLGGYLPTLAYVTSASSEGAVASDAPSLARWWRSLCAGEIVSAASLGQMTDFGKHPEYGLGIMDRRPWHGRGALGHPGKIYTYNSAALCFPDHGIVIVVLANTSHDNDTTVSKLMNAVIS